MQGLSFKILKSIGSFDLNVAAHLNDGLMGILGKPGSGKTTLLKILGGYLEPDVGQINFNDELYFSSEKRVFVPAEFRKVGLVWQEGLLFPHMNVGQNIFYGGEKCPLDFAQRVTEILEVNHLMNSMPHRLSAVERHRVAIARALLREPMLLLVDEPDPSLTIAERQNIISCLRTIHQKLRIPLICVSQSVSELFFLVQKVLVLDNGNYISYDSPERIFINERQLVLLDEDFENILELRVLRHNAEEQVLELDFGGVPLKAACSHPHREGFQRVGIKAKDIMIATERVTNISARNRITATIERVDPSGELIMVCCRLNDRRLWIELTPGAYRELRLRQNQLVYLLIASRSVRLLQ